MRSTPDIFITHHLHAAAPEFHVEQCIERMSLTNLGKSRWFCCPFLVGWIGCCKLLLYCTYIVTFIHKSNTSTRHTRCNPDIANNHFHLKLLSSSGYIMLNHMYASFHSRQFSRNFASPLQMRLIGAHGVAESVAESVADSDVLIIYI